MLFDGDRFLPSSSATSISPCSAPVGHCGRPMSCRASRRLQALAATAIDRVDDAIAGIENRSSAKPVSRSLLELELELDPHMPPPGPAEAAIIAPDGPAAANSWAVAGRTGFRP